jgi:hypothetical protein
VVIIFELGYYHAANCCIFYLSGSAVQTGLGVTTAILFIYPGNCNSFHSRTPHYTFLFSAGVPAINISDVQLVALSVAHAIIGVSFDRFVVP